MAIKRYTADADNTITNAYKQNLTIRGTGSNMGEADVLEVFSIYAQESSSSSELSRVLIKFPATGTSAGYISYDRTQDDIPDSGSVSFYLRMFNARHVSTTPEDFDLVISAVTRSWNEGVGLDMEDYSDRDASNWVNAERSSSTSEPYEWAAEGGDWYTDSSSSFTASFSTGFEDLELDITPLVEQWVNSSGNVLGSKSNYGLMVRLSSSLEDGTESYYTKKFFARGSQFFFKRPVIEARWDSSEKDDRGSFYYSSSLAPAADNLNTIYFYNYVRGQLKNIPDVGSTGSILVSLYSGSSTNDEPSGAKLLLSAGGNVAADEDTEVTGGYVSTGIYSASLAFTGATTLSTIYDVWHSGSTEFFTGTIEPQNVSSSWSAEFYNPDQAYVSKITNMKSTYLTINKNARFRLYSRKKDWSPTIYTVASNVMPIDLVEDAYYKVERVIDGFDAIPYGTGTLNHTRLSFDKSGSYFDLDMSMLEADSTYEIKFVYYLNGEYSEQEESFKFKVE